MIWRDGLGATAARHSTGSFPTPGDPVPHLGCPFPTSPAAPGPGAAHTVALEIKAPHLPREKDPNHGVKYCWIHVI